MLALALLAAVAGGNLAVTAAPTRPHVGHQVIVRATGQVGDTGHFYLYRARRSSCAATAQGERRRGIRVASRRIDGSFDFEVSFTPRRVGRLWICGYLYADTCDAAGQNCGPATGLPPDAGFSQVRVSVRAAARPPTRASATTPRAPSFTRF